MLIFTSHRYPWERHESTFPCCLITGYVDNNKKLLTTDAIMARGIFEYYG